MRICPRKVDTQYIKMKMLAFTYLHFLLLSISWLLSVLHLLSWIGLYLVRTEALLDRLIFVLDAAGAWGTKEKRKNN